MKRRKSLVVFMLIIIPCLIACAWDYDTIKMERSRFPSTLELITGKFLRHSPEFYQWRIENRLKRLEADPENLALLDDLAVAYDKTGQHNKAIETAFRAEKIKPDRYETAANLGTFYFHSGQLSEGIPFIEKALQINPDAHFGRERYQLLLVEYMIERRDMGNIGLPLASIKKQIDNLETIRYVEQAFPKYLQDRDHKLLNNKRDAVKGILGMMKFGNHRAPALLEVLAFLLVSDQDEREDAKLLAARAFLKASYEIKDEDARQSYRQLATNALSMQVPRPDQPSQITLEQVETDFKKELAEADEWYRQLHESEKAWIRDGLDPEKEFDKLYSVEPEQSGMDVTDPQTWDQIWNQRIITTVISCFGITMATIAVGIFFVVRNRRRRFIPKLKSLP